MWDGGEGREGGRSEMRVVGISRAPGARSGVGAVGGRGQTGPRAHFCGGICVPNSSSCDIDGHRASRRASRVALAESGEVGRAPVKTFLERPRPLINTRAVFQGTTLDVAHERVHDRLPRLPPPWMASTVARLLTHGPARHFSLSRVHLGLNRRVSTIARAHHSCDTRRSIATMASHGPEPPPAKKAKENSWDKNGDTFNKVASSAAAERNRQPIADVVVPMLKGENGGLLVELACGTGQHAAHIAPLLPALTWLPTDLTDESFDSIRHHCSDVENVLEPAVLDASDASWPDGFAGSWEIPVGVLVVNMTHISPWSATVGTIVGASKLLEGSCGVLMIYGPFKRNGEHTSEGNATFDETLRGRNKEWGYRDIGEVESLGEVHGFVMEKVLEMPANNFMLIMRRRAKIEPVADS